MKILVIGAGMYVTGRNGTGVGTVLSSLAQISKEIPIEEVVIAAKNPNNDKIIKQEITRINQTIGADLKVSYSVAGEDIEESINKLCAANEFNAAIVCVPDHLHFEYVYQLLKRSIHILVVKPLVATVEEHQKLIALQEEKKVLGVVEFHKRYDEANLYNKKLLLENKIGKISYITVDFSQRITIPSNIFSKWAPKTNIFQYLGVHYIDLIYFLTGYQALKVSAHGINGILKKKGIDTYDSVQATILWHNPADPKDIFSSTFNTNWIDPECSSAMSDQKYKIIGTNGRIECDQKNRGIEVVEKTGGVQHINPYFSTYLPDANGQMEFQGYGYKSIVQFVIDVMQLEQGEVSLSDLLYRRPSFQDTFVTTKVIEAVNACLAANN